MTGPLREELADYLALRRALGYRLARPEKLLGQFLDHLERAGEARITVAAALDWARLPAGGELELVGLPAVGGARVRHLPARPGPGARGAGRGAAAAAAAPRQPVPVFRRRHRRADRGHRLAAHPAATGHVRHADRVAGGDRDPGRRSDRARPRRRRPRRRAAGGPSRQVRQDPGTGPAPHDRRRAAPLPAAARPARPGRPAHRRCSCPRPGPGCSTATSTTPSTAWSAWPGSRPRSGSCRPRIHDLRHSFAVAAMLDAYAAGQDGQTRLTLLSTWLGHVHPASTYWYLSAVAGADGRRRAAARSAPGSRRQAVMTALAPTLQAFFTDRLIRQRHASAHTIAAYRDTLRLLLGYAASRTGVAPSRLDLADLDAPLIGGFLDHLEHERGNSVRTRNARLAAIHSLFRFAALAHPEHADSIARVLAIPPKRFDRALISYLDRARGRRAARLLRPDHLDRATRPRPAAARRPDRATDLRTDRAHPRRRAPRRRRARRLPRQRPQRPDHPAHQRHRRRPARLARRTPRRPRRAAVPDPSRHHAQPRRDRTPPRPLHRQAATGCPSLHGKTITAHVLRHTTAMRLLHAGVDTSVIALWLGHVSVETTQIYLHADLKLKEKALARTRPPNGRDRPIPAHPTACSPGSKRSDYADLASPNPCPATESTAQHRHNPEVGIMEPTALLPRAGEHLAQCAPEPKRAVADREDRRAHPTPGESRSRSAHDSADSR